MKDVLFKLKELADDYMKTTHEPLKMFRMNILSATLFLASISNSRPRFESRQTSRNKVISFFEVFFSKFKEKQKGRMHIKMAVSDLDT